MFERRETTVTYSVTLFPKGCNYVIQSRLTLSNKNVTEYVTFFFYIIIIIIFFSFDFVSTGKFLGFSEVRFNNNKCCRLG
jgi:hypothetical protein